MATCQQSAAAAGASCFGGIEGQSVSCKVGQSRVGCCEPVVSQNPSQKGWASPAARLAELARTDTIFAEMETAEAQLTTLALASSSLISDGGGVPGTVKKTQVCEYDEIIRVVVRSSAPCRALLIACLRPGATRAAIVA